MNGIVDTSDRAGELGPVPSVGVNETVAFTRRLRSWLTSGACQDAGGAFYAWRDEVSGEPAFAYPEITGYALTFLAGRTDPTPQEIAAGRRAAAWLTARLAAGNWAARDTWDGGVAYTFDLAMIGTGLLRFGCRFGDLPIVTAGLSVVRALQDQMRAIGTLITIFPKGGGCSKRSGWSVDGRAHLLKCVQCLLLAGELGMPETVDSAAVLVQQSLALMDESGRFITQHLDNLTMLHPHLYAIEGLWLWGTARGDSDAIVRARAALEWMWPHQLATGGFPRHVLLQQQNAPLAIEQCDVTAQAVRVACLLGLRLPGFDAAIARLESLARPTGCGSAMIYQPSSPHIHHNSWATMFAAQALEISRSNAAPLGWKDLV